VQKNDGVQVLAVADNETTVIPLQTEQQLVADQDDEDVLRLLLLCSKLGLPVVASAMAAAMEQVVIAVMEQVMAAGARLLDVAGAGGGIGASGGGYVGHCCVGVGYATYASCMRVICNMNREGSGVITKMTLEAMHARIPTCHCQTSVHHAVARRRHCGQQVLAY